MALDLGSLIELDSEGQRATVSLQFDLGASFEKKGGADTRQFTPSVALEEITVNGERRPTAP